MVFILITSLLFIFSEPSYSDILPPNNLHLEDNIGFLSNVDKETFFKIIDEVEKIYKPIIKETHDKKLFIRKNWDSSTVNATASQLLGIWTVNMYGGLARRAEVTPDGFALVLCHELGHHLAGYPFSNSWAANEGQSDYFATLSCARELWKDKQEENAVSSKIIEGLPKQLCDDHHLDEPSRNLCYRMILAGKSLSDLLGALKNQETAYDKPSIKTVKKTSHSHPPAQCRLDTFVAGALCFANFDAEVIPGKSLGSDRNSKKAEEEAAQYSCTRNDYDVGVRPLCWFKPKL